MNKSELAAELGSVTGVPPKDVANVLDKLTDIREDKTYQAVYLENEYIKLCVIPELVTPEITGGVVSDSAEVVNVKSAETARLPASSLERTR